MIEDRRSVPPASHAGAVISLLKFFGWNKMTLLNAQNCSTVADPELFSALNSYAQSENVRGAE